MPLNIIILEFIQVKNDAIFKILTIHDFIPNKLHF